MESRSRPAHRGLGSSRSRTQVTYVGHATVLIEVAGTRLLTDPLLRRRVAHLRRIAPLPALPAITSPDAVLISHAHLDHLDLPSLRRLSLSGPTVVPRGLARLARRARVHDVREVDVGDRVGVGDVEVLATLAEHDGRRMPFGRATRALGYLLRGPRRIYFAGDTDLFDGMRDIADGLDLALLPVSGWGPTLPQGHLDPERAARAAALLRPRVAVPIHWGTLATPWGRTDDPERPAREFVRLAASHAPGSEVRILRPGASLRL